MKKINKLLFVIPFAFMMFGCSKSTKKESKSTDKTIENKTTTNKVTKEIDKKFNITFDSNGGSNVIGQEVIKGEKITEPTTPTKEGYTFEGWYYNDTLHMRLPKSAHRPPFSTLTD